MKLSKEQIELMIETLEELAEELSDNKHGSLVTEQWDLLEQLKKANDMAVVYFPTLKECIKHIPEGLTTPCYIYNDHVNKYTAETQFREGYIVWTVMPN